jgi:hypothetical protein
MTVYFDTIGSVVLEADVCVIVSVCRCACVRVCVSERMKLRKRK